jgi:hypothetical protein
MRKDTLNKITAELKTKFPDVGIQSIEVNEKTGQSTFYLQPTKKSLAFIDSKSGGGIIPRTFKERAAVISRDTISRTNLDLAAKDPYTEDPKESFKRAIKYYYTDPLVGSSINILANLAKKGFENDIDDPKIKQFYDAWAFDVGFDELLDWIFLDFFKVGHVTTYKVLAKYEPRVSYLSPVPGQKPKTVKKESAAKKGIWSKGFLPVAYTVLNPALVSITGNLLFNKTSVVLTPPPELRDLLKKPKSELTEDEKSLIKALPTDLKSAAEKGGEFTLDSRFVNQITYRKQPYERYARPKTLKVFDTIEYKNALRQADLSTLDGITNYILKVTIGNDEYPVVNQQELEAIGALFNTPSKAVDIIWNHTLQIEKIVSPEIDKILGKGKYEQVNEDMTTGLAITHAILDGTGNINAAEVDLLVKGLMEEINYARRQVTRWIYKEYQQIAEAVGFDRFPKIRFDTGVLLDTILHMNTLAALTDRRMLSYRTSLESLGFDYPNELKNMEEELPLVQEGVFGIVGGSPFQQSKQSIQPVQNSPKGTPSRGRPTGQPAGPKKPNVNPARQPGLKPVKKAVSINDVTDMSPTEYTIFLDGARGVLSENEYIEFSDWAGRKRFNG